MKKTLLALGIIALVLIPIYIFLAVPELEKVPANYEFSAQLFHSENNRFEINGVWTGIKELKSIWNEKLNGNNLETNFVVGEGKEMTYEIKNKFIVNLKSRHNLAGETDKNGEAYSVFPLNVKKEDYNYWPAGYGQSLLFKFHGVEQRSGLSVYHFLVENGVSDDTAGYEFLDLVPEKYKILSKFEVSVYVEPVSGIIVDYADKGTSYYADFDGNKFQDISEWGNKFSYDTIKIRADIAKSEKLKIRILEIYVPVLLVIIGLVLLSVGFVRKSEKKV